jgi:V/A-type H+-transporting ATPase subunit C
MRPAVLRPAPPLVLGVYAFLHGRLGALKGQLLTNRSWNTLLDAHSFFEQRQLLLQTSYGPWVGETVDVTVRTLQGALHRAVRVVERSVPPEAGSFVRMWGRRDLLRNVKTILKGKALGQSEEDIHAQLLDVDPGHVLPLTALLRCASVEAVLDLLEHTELAHWIREARRIYERDPTLFGLEAALDRRYYSELWDRVEQLKPWDRQAVEALVADEIDQVNLMWLFRYRLNYRLSPAEAYYLLVPVMGRLGAEELKRLARQQSLEGMAMALTREPFASMVRRSQTLRQVEIELSRHRARAAARALREAAFTLGEGLALLVLREIERRDLIAVLEGVRFGNSREEIEEQLGVAHVR